MPLSIFQSIRIIVIVAAIFATPTTSSPLSFPEQRSPLFLPPVPFHRLDIDLLQPSCIEPRLKKFTLLLILSHQFFKPNAKQLTCSIRSCFLTFF